MFVWLWIGLSDLMNKLIQENRKLQGQIKEQLQMMQADYNDTKLKFPKEPECRVKNTVH